MLRRTCERHTDVEYRKLGDTGIDVSEIGFGTWGLGGSVRGSVAYGPTDDGESRRALRRAFDLGVTFYDTSDFYGYGHSERLVGEALSSVRPQVTVATKVGMVSADAAQNFSPDHIRRSLEASLDRLKTDYVDLYQLHSPPMDLLRQDDAILAVLQALVEEGKVRALGVSLRSPDDGRAAICELGFKCIQVNFSLADQRTRQTGLLDLATSHGVGIIARTPLCFGFLTGNYSAESQFDPSDHRRRWSPHQLDRWASAVEVFSSPDIRDGGQTDAQFALRFCLSYPAVSTAIPGMLAQQQVEENVQATRLGPLGPQQIAEVERIYQAHSFFVEERA